MMSHIFTWIDGPLPEESQEAGPGYSDDWIANMQSPIDLVSKYNSLIFKGLVSAKIVRFQSEQFFPRFFLSQFGFSENGSNF